VAGNKSRKKFLRVFVGASVLAALLFIFFLSYLWLQSRELSFVKYPEFGIEIPSSYEIHGIDVSRYQQNISWEMVEQMQVRDIRIGFAFIKATEGNNNADPYFRRNWKRSREAGLVRGAYHFFIASKDGKTQARNFIKRVKIESGDLPPVLDVEQNSRMPAHKLRAEVKAWLDVVEEYYGVRPIIYTNVSFYEQYLQGHFDDYPLWVAHYFQPQKPRIRRDWSFWQHSEEGRVNGIVSKVDFNVFNGDSLEFRSLLIP
jgi:lysozyme